MTFYEELSELVKERDGWKCTEPGRKRKALPIHLKAVRIDPAEPDSLDNLRTVCRWDLPEYE